MARIKKANVVGERATMAKEANGIRRAIKERRMTVTTKSIGRKAMERVIAAIKEKNGIGRRTTVTKTRSSIIRRRAGKVEKNGNRDK